jgi:Tfp pilus assembly protein PilV
MKHPSDTKRDGFTLIEALIGVFILTLSLAGSIALTTTLLRANSFSTRMTTAVTLAQSKIDDLSEDRYADIATGNDTVSIYQRSWVVVPGASTKTINVTVTWQSIDGRARQAALSTIVDDRI